MKVTVELAGQEQVLPLGAREMAGADIDVFSPQSPLGQAIHGARRGETVTYQAPNGKDVKVQIIDAVPYAG